MIDVLACTALGYILPQLGQGEEAKTNMQIAVFVKPSSPIVLYPEGGIAHQRRQIDDALIYSLLAFAYIENKPYSSSYHYRTYNHFFLQSDITPQSRRHALISHMIIDLNVPAPQFEINSEHI